MILYLDTSALIKLYAEEPRTEEVRTAVEEAEVVAISEIGYVEARSALARKEREGSLSTQEHDEIVDQLDSDFQEVYLLRSLTGRIIAHAGELTREHGLRAYDAVHLTTALTLREETRDLAGASRDPGESSDELRVQVMSYDSAVSKAARSKNIAYAPKPPPQ